jgi:hydrogenase nickel incorporation protein HypA/HybF
MLGGEPGMHELSLAQHLLDLALERARLSGAERIVGLHLVVGQLAPLEESSLSFYWEHVSQATPAAGSTVHVKRLPMTLVCLDCGRAFQPGGEVWACPGCHSERVRLQGGDESYLEAIDVEVATGRQGRPWPIA